MAKNRIPVEQMVLPCGHTYHRGIPIYSSFETVKGPRGLMQMKVTGWRVIVGKNEAKTIELRDEMKVGTVGLAECMRQWMRTKSRASLNALAETIGDKTTIWSPVMTCPRRKCCSNRMSAISIIFSCGDHGTYCNWCKEIREQVIARDGYPSSDELRDYRQVMPTRLW